MLLIRTVLPSSAPATPLFAFKKGFASLQAIAPHRLAARTVDGRMLATIILGALLVKVDSQRYRCAPDSVRRKGNGIQGLGGLLGPCFYIDRLGGRGIVSAVIAVRAG